jgi:hypothetical protein
MPDEESGGLHAKFPWWRAASGALTIRGRRLDASAAPMGPHIPAGYGDRGFQPTGLLFPSEGCWEVTGSAAGEHLTFVVKVRRWSGS